MPQGPIIFRPARQARPPLSIPRPPRRPDIVDIRLPSRSPINPARRPCGLCAKVRKLLGLRP